MTANTKLIVPEQPREALPAATTASGAMLNMLERGARDPSVDIDKMERLFAMRQQIVAEERQTAFNAAMAACQADMPAVTRDAVNDQTGSPYAKLETIAQAIKPIYTKHGFGLSFDEGDCPKEGYIRILCDVSHAAGHTVRKHFDLPLDSVGIKGSVNKTVMHASGSTISYGRRYLTCMIFNVALQNEDNDGNRPRPEPVITEKQLADLECLITEVKADKAKFLRYIKANSLEDIRASSYDAAVRLLQAKRRQS